jgi:hypothetical protein
MTIELQKQIDAAGVDKSAVFGKIFQAIGKMMPKQAMDSSQTNAYDLAIAELEHAKSMDEKAEGEQHKALLRASGAIDKAEKHLKEAHVYAALEDMYKIAIDPRILPNKPDPIKKVKTKHPPASPAPSPQGANKKETPRQSREWWKQYGSGAKQKQTPKNYKIISGRDAGVSQRDDRGRKPTEVHRKPTEVHRKPTEVHRKPTLRFSQENADKLKAQSDAGHAEIAKLKEMAARELASSRNAVARNRKAAIEARLEEEAASKNNIVRVAQR